MASKRKSTIPCMIPVKTMHLQDDLERERRSPLSKDIGFSFREEACKIGSPSLGNSSGQEAGDIQKDIGTYTCRPCNFETQDLNLFLDHVYSGHPDFRVDPCFLCVDCGVRAAKFEGLALHNARVHHSTMNTTLQLKRKDNKIAVEQSLVTGPCESNSLKETEISISKTPIMKMLKGKSEPKRIVISHPASDDPSSSVTKPLEKTQTPVVTVTHVPTIVHNGAANKVALSSAIQIVNASGVLPLLKTAVTQVVSVVQNRSVNPQSAPIAVSSSPSSSSSTKNLPKVMIPLSSIPTYNASMDNSSFLKTSFSKFPYPTKAELCYLTVVTKYPEEQIKIWFTAQRLKQGISWSPEEIEDARRKMFNTIIQTAPSSSQQQRLSHQTTSQQTITVLGTTGIPQILQGSLVGQGGVIVTQPMITNGIQVSSAPVTLAVTPKPQAAAKPMMQARPAAALVADKGIGMVLGTVGSSSSGNCSSSVSTGSSSSSISSTSSLNSQACVIGVDCSGTAKSNSDSDVRAYTPGANDTCIQSNGNSVKSTGENNKSSSNCRNNGKAAASTTPAATVTSTTTTDCTIPSKSDSPRHVSMNSRMFSTASLLDPSFNKTKKSQEQLAALKDSFLVSQFPNQAEVDRLIGLTGLTVREVRKWFSDRRYHFRNLKGSRMSAGGQTAAASASGSQFDALVAVDLSENSTPPERPKTPQQTPISPSQTTSPPTPTRRPPRPPSPDFTAIRYKEREPHQVRALEASFAQDPDPCSEEVDRLRAETKMTRREIHSWFAERRRRVAAEKKKEEAERAERDNDDDGKEKEKTSTEETHEADSPSEKQKEETGTEPKVNPIKINLKMLKVTESNGKDEPEGSEPTEATKVLPSGSQAMVTQASSYRGKKTPEQLHLLKQVFARTHWPSCPQYNELIAKTGLLRPEVVRWFGDCRYVSKNGQLKWLESYQAMVDEEDFQKANISVLKEHLDTYGKLDESKLEDIVKSSGLGEESIRRWFVNKVPLLENSKAGSLTAASPTETALESQHPEEVEQLLSSLISKDQATE
ncbi:zinc fingers and homeoboxes protein 3 [Triplophysa rosa]|uniref:Zinc fingers and homeoboxes protein 3 n=1 Tax=Triplophysa rosa TaxID=992332 RepID=A0A9W7TDY3_TRIRA|nr:zinc fingers and homeoboxes protein 3 [Triplophysa rosa]KAI7794736.1 putative zinc fingers and homeoboxes protein 3 [Triplophysa rosa]